MFEQKVVVVCFGLYGDAAAADIGRIRCVEGVEMRIGTGDGERSRTDVHTPTRIKVFLLLAVRSLPVEHPEMVAMV